ncbi:MAG: polyhydroxyalkanoate synthesis regulator DNA-binding domain-containing protein [Pseudomonadota bacterium]
MSEIRVIKKYPNRRLYDTTISSYITLEDTRRLIQAGVTIQVIEASTKSDITHGTLLQIILELEQKKQPVFTNEELQYLVRAYEINQVEEVQGVFKDAFEKLAKLVARSAPQTLAEPAKPLQSPWKPIQQESWLSRVEETTE